MPDVGGRRRWTRIPGAARSIFGWLGRPHASTAVKERSKEIEGQTDAAKAAAKDAKQATAGDYEFAETDTEGPERERPDRSGDGDDAPGSDDETESDDTK